MKKRFLLVGLTTFTSLLASCGGSIDPNASLSVDLSKKIDLVTYFPASGKSNDFFNNSYIPQKLKEITGYKVTYNQTTDLGADTQIGNMLIGKDPINMMKIAPTLFNNYVTQGYFTDLTEIINIYGKDLKSNITEEQWEAATYNGKIYAIPEIGHTAMQNTALVWNTDHLKSVGITKIPETLSEFDKATAALQAKFGPNNANYHAFGLPGTHSEENLLTTPFEVPKNYYVDNGEITPAIFSPNTEKYVTYLNSLNNSGVLARSWTTTVATNVLSNFTNENISVGVVSYWHVEPLKEMLMSTEKYKNNREAVDNLVAWNPTLRGDGTNGSYVQEKAKVRNYQGCSYYCTIPVACAKDAAYVVDWMNTKVQEQASTIQIVGEEGKHFEYVSKDDPDAVQLLDVENIYAKTLPLFNEDIHGMSQYQTGANIKIGRKFWPLPEKQFNAWSILFTDTENLIEDPFALHPVLPKYAKTDLKAKNQYVTSLQQIISPSNGKTVEENLASARNIYLSKYWKDEVKNEVNNWYKTTGKN